MSLDTCQKNIHPSLSLTLSERVMALECGVRAIEQAVGPGGGIQSVVTSQDVVTGSRAANAVYQNTSGATMFVMSCWHMLSGTAQVSFVSDANNPPTTVVGLIADPGGTGSTTLELFAPVLDGYFYQCQVMGSPVLVSWTEYS